MKELTATTTELPRPPVGKTSWPWTSESSAMPEAMPDGRPWPRISIVTPSFTQGGFIEETIRSILLQGYPNLEYIIIDGGSKDESVEIIRKYEPWLSYWVSEADRGQSHAINKGLERCTGEVFNWINSDDLLWPDALREVAYAWSARPDSIIAGSLETIKPDGTRRTDHQHNITLQGFLDKEERRRSGMQWNQPASFLPLRRVREVGGVNEGLRFTMDWFLMIAVLEHCEIQYVPKVLSCFRLHPASKSMMDAAEFPLETARMMDSDECKHRLPPDRAKQWRVHAFLDAAEVSHWSGRHVAAFRYALRAASLSIGETLREIGRRRLLARSLSLMASIACPLRRLRLRAGGDRLCGTTSGFASKSKMKVKALFKRLTGK